MSKLRVAVIGAGSFGRHHVRVVKEIPGVELTATVDPKVEGALKTVDEVIGRIDAAIIATPTVTHESIASRLLEAGIDVLVEKPIAETSEGAQRLAHLAQKTGRILQAGHLERFNPAVTALEKALTVPLFFEVHRLSVFTPRSLDIDVVLDLMIHDLQLVSAWVGEPVREIRAAGAPVLTPRLDIAQARIEFEGGCVANLTASRVSSERMRKLRVFSADRYCSVDMDARTVEASRLSLDGAGAGPRIEALPVPVPGGDSLELELADFVAAVRERREPLVNGEAARDALRLAGLVSEAIDAHRRTTAGRSA